MTNRSEYRQHIATALLVAQVQHDGLNDGERERLAREAVALADELLEALDKDRDVGDAAMGTYA